MMLPLHEAMVQELATHSEVTVRDDIHPATGISKPRLINWPLLSLAQARRFQPRATVVFIGANDGFPLTTSSGRSAHCCGAVWRYEYSQRVARMMRAYARRGRGRVYWVQLPQTRSRGLRRIYAAVNSAVRLAGKRQPAGVRLVRLDRLLTPHGHYSDTIVFQGRRIRVRKHDRIHLTIEGASIGAAIIVQMMIRDGVLASVPPKSKPIYAGPPLSAKLGGGG